MAQIADVVIIGSGALGCAAAFALAEAGVRRVNVVDRGPLISGMTRRNAGLVHTYQPDGALTLLASSSLVTYRHWATLIGGTCGFVETGTLISATAPDQVKALELQVAAQSRNGISSRTVTPNEVMAEFPNTALDGVAFAAYEPGSGYLDAVLASQGFARRAREKGVKFDTGSQVKQIGQERGRIIDLTTTTGSIQTPTVIVAAGGGAERLLWPLGVALNLQSRRGVIGFFEQPVQLYDGHPTLLDIDTHSFLRPHAFHLSAAGILTGAAHAATEALDDLISASETTSLAAYAARRVPLLAGAPCKRSHAILYDRPPDGLPVLGRVPGFDGLYLMAGFGESAVATAPGVGRAITEIIVDGRSKINLDAFRPDRPTIGKATTR